MCHSGLGSDFLTSWHGVPEPIKNKRFVRRSSPFFVKSVDTGPCGRLGIFAGFTNLQVLIKCNQYGGRLGKQEPIKNNMFVPISAKNGWSFLGIPALVAILSRASVPCLSIWCQTNWPAHFSASQHGVQELLKTTCSSGVRPILVHLVPNLPWLSFFSI